MICPHLTNHAGWGKNSARKSLSPRSTRMPSQGSDLVRVCGVDVVSMTYKLCESFGYHMVYHMVYHIVYHMVYHMVYHVVVWYSCYMVSIW